MSSVFIQLGHRDNRVITGSTALQKLWKEKEKDAHCTGRVWSNVLSGCIMGNVTASRLNWDNSAATQLYESDIIDHQSAFNII